MIILCDNTTIYAPCIRKMPTRKVDVAMTDALRLQALKAAKFRTDRQKNGLRGCAACGGTTSNPEHTLCHSCWLRSPVSMRNDPKAFEDLVAYLRQRKSKLFKWIDGNTLESGSGWLIAHSRQNTENVWCLKNPFGQVVCTRKRLIDVFSYFDETSAHNRCATKTLVR